MQRSSRWRRRRPTGSTTSAHATGQPLATSQPSLTAVRAGTGRLADGLVIDATIHGRLLGIRLMRIEAGLIVSPARFVTRASAGDGVFAPRNPLDERRHPIGADLAAAQRCIRAGRATLAGALPPPASGLDIPIPDP
jgi:hypothetical protein